MTDNKPFTSAEVQELVNHWQICRFVKMETMETIISLPHFDLYFPNSRIKCHPQALAKIKAALTQAYAQGTRDVGMFAPPALRTEIVTTAMRVSKDPEWRVFPLWEPTYFNNLLLTQQKILLDALLYAEMDEELKVVEKNICDQLGFTEDILLELAQYRHVKNVMDLPVHLRRLFVDGREENVNLEQTLPNQKQT